jgi:hypothetical protein
MRLKAVDIAQRWEFRMALITNRIGGVGRQNGPIEGLIARKLGESLTSAGCMAVAVWLQFGRHGPSPCGQSVPRNTSVG